MQCKRKLMFDNDISIDVKSKRMYRRSVLGHNFEKCLKKKNNQYEKQGVEFSHISEMNITFTTYLWNLTYRHNSESPMPMVERIFSRNFYKEHNLIKSLDGIDLLLHMGPHETGEADI